MTSTNVIYQPVLNYVGADLFRYAVGDGRGGFGTNVVTLNITTFGAANRFYRTVYPAY